MLRRRHRLLIAILLLWGATAFWQTHKPLPAGTHVSAIQQVAAADVRFLHDLTWQFSGGTTHHEQQIFDAVLAQVDEAQHFIVLDFFLFNDDRGHLSNSAPLRPLSRQLADHLLARKRAVPELQVLLVTDPINAVYGGAPSALLTELAAAGIRVVYTDLRPLRDSNAGYSAVWRGLLQWWGNSAEGGWLPNPLEASALPITLRSWLSLLNFKANHRKVVVTDDAQGRWTALITSANPHDASSSHSNVALQVRGPLAAAIVNSELDVARFSGWQETLTLPAPPQQDPATTRVEAAYVTEAAIREQLLRTLQATQRGDEIHLAMFYLSHRDVIEALKGAAQRGVQVQLILDPNKDAFGLRKNGIPNRPVAHELVNAGQGNLAVRWYRTSGEQFHTKLLLVRHGATLSVTLGSANFTRRNLDDFNLEANLALSLPVDGELSQQFTAYFDRLWQSNEHTADFAAYEDASSWHYWMYRMMEFSGLSTF